MGVALHRFPALLRTLSGHPPKGGLLALAMSVFLFSWDSKNTTRRGQPVLALLAWAPYIVGMLLSF